MPVRIALPLVVLLLLAVPAARGETPAEGERRFLYVGKAPKDRDGFRTMVPSIEVHDIDDGHKLVRVIPLPSPDGTPKVQNIRGIMANAPTRRLYVSHYGSMKGLDTGWVMAVDLVTERVLWHRQYESAVDRGAVTPDGRKIFMPSGESVPTEYFYVIDAATGEEDASARIPVAGKTHNTIVSLDGSKVFMSAFGTKYDHLYLHVADAETNRPIGRVGPTENIVRPFTINGDATLAYVTVNRLLGFQVGDVASGKILFTATPPADPYPQPAENKIYCHGIALTSDEREVWVVDQTRRSGIHVFDVSGVPAQPPRWMTFIDTASGREKDDAGKPLYEDKGIFGQPGWLMGTIDGRYIYPETGEIIDARSKQIVGHLTGANGLRTHSRFMLEVDFVDGVPTRCGDQFVVGRARSPAEAGRAATGR
jgi:hypothetical protein